MKRPKIAKVTIQWMDDNGDYQIRQYSENTLEEAETLLSLMTGNSCESDLEP